MPQCPYPCPANPLQGQTRTQPMRARTLGAAELVSHSLSNTPRPVPVGTVCAQNCSQHPSTAKASNDGTGPLIASLSRCGPAPQKQPLWTAWPQPTGRGIKKWEGGERGTSSQHPRGSPTAAHPRAPSFSFGFLPWPSCLICLSCLAVGPNLQRGEVGRGAGRPAVATLPR